MKCVLLHDDETTCKRWAAAAAAVLGPTAVVAECIDRYAREVELESSLPAFLSDEDRVLLVSDCVFQTANRDGWGWARLLRGRESTRSFHYAILSGASVTVSANAAPGCIAAVAPSGAIPDDECVRRIIEIWRDQEPGWDSLHQSPESLLGIDEVVLEIMTAVQTASLLQRHPVKTSETGELRVPFETEGDLSVTNENAGASWPAPPPLEEHLQSYALALLQGDITGADRCWHELEAEEHCAGMLARLGPGAAEVLRKDIEAVSNTPGADCGNPGSSPGCCRKHALQSLAEKWLTRI